MPMESSRHCASFTKNLFYIKKKKDNAQRYIITLCEGKLYPNWVRSKLADRPEWTHTPIRLHIPLVCRMSKRVFQFFLFWLLVQLQLWRWPESGKNWRVGWNMLRILCTSAWALVSIVYCFRFFFLVDHTK